MGTEPGAPPRDYRPGDRIRYARSDALTPITALVRFGWFAGGRWWVLPEYPESAKCPAPCPTEARRWVHNVSGAPLGAFLDQPRRGGA